MAYQNASPVVNAFGKTRLQESLERARDRQGPSLGQWLALPGHALAKTIAPLGEDWVLIDCEHGHIDDYNMYLQISAISSSGVSPVVRIPAGEPWMVKRALDAGAHAIMVPMCETKEQAMQIVESAKYPSKSYPNGFRGTGAMFAPAAFNLTGREYFLNANSNVMIFVQIESRKGVENVEEIAKVDGIDMLFIGPNDLASSLGYVAFDHATTPEVQQATQRILDATLAAGKYAGHFALDAATAAQRYEQGFHFVNCGADIVALTSQMSAEIRKVKDLTTKDLAYNAANGSGSENGVKSLDGRGNGSVDAVKLYYRSNVALCDPCHMNADILQRLVDSLRSNPVSMASRHVTWDPYPKFNFQASDDLKQDFLWGTLSSFSRPGDVIIGETGTSAFGLCDTKLPSRVMMFNQTVYGSIGYATGAIVGVGQAIKESEGKWKRPVLVTGEGSMHLTIQALADMLRWDLKPIIFVLNNGGYTVERLIHGKEAVYNEVAVLDYSMLGKTFGPAFESKYHGPIKTCGELSSLLRDPNFGNVGCLELVELILPPLDAPSAVIKTGAAIDAFNKAKAEQGPSGIQGA
ncbi:hypothetical protein FOVSG1_010760 [Fusarium oxysporum f. sp. vasinfectum]